MKTTFKYLCLLPLMVGFAHINADEESSPPVDYSQMSTAELDSTFILAVKNLDLEAVETLLQAGANIDTPIPYTWTSGDCDWDIETSALIYAVREGESELVKVLAKVDTNLTGALREAIGNGYSGVVTTLVDCGADLHYSDESGNTPLFIAIQNSRATSEFSLQAHSRQNSRWWLRRQIIQTLIKAGSDVTHTNNQGRTPLMEAIIEHDLNTVESLLKNPKINPSSYFGYSKKPINYVDNDGNTALILAIKSIRYRYINDQEYKICVNSQKIVDALLVTQGLDVHHVNNAGETALSLLEAIHAKAS